VNRGARPRSGRSTRPTEAKARSESDHRLAPRVGHALVDELDGCVDMSQCAIWRPRVRSLYFFLLHVAVGRVEELARAMHAAAPIEPVVHGWVVIDVLSIVIDASDFVDGRSISRWQPSRPI